MSPFLLLYAWALPSLYGLSDTNVGRFISDVERWIAKIEQIGCKGGMADIDMT